MRVIYTFLLVMLLPLTLHAGSLQATKQAAMEGDARAQYELAIRYLKGDSVEKDGKRAVKWLTSAAEQGHASAQYKLGMLYREGRRVSTDIDQAIEFLTMAADQGNPSAQYRLGEIYQQGDGVDKDLDEAKEWFELSAGHNFKKAVDALASLEAEEAEANTAAAVSSAGGRTEAQTALDALVNTGKATKAVAAQKDATTEITPADESAQSAHELGMKYLRGAGVKKSYRNAAKWFTQAAEQGLAESQYQLGELLNKGKGVRRNKKHANKWYRAAAKQGHIKAKGRLKGCGFC